MEHLDQVDLLQPFVSAFTESLAAALTLGQATAWEVKCLDNPEAEKPREQAINVRLSMTGGLQGGCFVALDLAQVAAIRAQPPAEPASSEDRPVEALDAVLAAAAETLTVTLATQYGVLNVQVDRVDEVPSDKMLLAALSASSGEGQVNTILLSFDEVLVASLTSAHEAKHPAKSKKAAIEPTNFQLVMDVELNVSLRFGQCQLPLRDVLDLNSGSVIELDRDVDDPVELLLDGKVIARGEAVIVDGNYGLRITEIPQPIASHFSSQPFRG